ncbi:Metalloprotease PmbA [bioreactor metagenome]|uniref:Metalloprotease PmbA n=1 Tax=bioreactor metagenome TaxID=1076179 RepID=A0A644ZTT5_9ZZZZ|nr:TldD/PmbA family protein [Candidatus Metalachnospira sp.]
MEIKEFQKTVIEKAKKRGFEDCEIYYQGGESFQIYVNNGEVEQYETSECSGAAFKGVINGKTGFAYSERFDEVAADFIVKSAIENADIDENTESEIFYSGGEYEKIKLYNDELDSVSVNEKINKAKDLEKAAISFSEKVRTVDRCIYGDDKSTVSIMNTRGLDAQYSTNSMVAYASVICAEDDDIKTGSDFVCGNDFNKFDAVSLGKKIAEETEKHLGAKSIKSGKYNVVFKNSAMSDVLATFSDSFSAEQAFKGLSMLEGKENKKIASDYVTIRDDALLENGYASAIFDGEGVPCENKAVVENGILTTFLYDLKYAAKAGKKSTGNGFRAGFKSPVSVGCTNFYIAKGSNSFDNAIKAVENGVLITDVEGLHAGANPVSGDFSLSAEGFLIENGKISAPIEQITVAGNFFKIIEGIKLVADDLKFGMNGVGAPSVLIENISISGL